MRTLLAIETSCDETAVAVIRIESINSIQILSEEISSQIDLHEAYGGVVPELASREHLKNLPLLVAPVMEESGLSFGDFDGIGVTAGPGLKGCLLVGIEYARGLSLAAGIPLYPVNHIEGHILSPLLENPGLDFPYLALIVSGGHTEIVVARAPGNYEVLARTLDDAAGEAFDKSAHLLGFSYPGGPALAALADTVEHSPFSLPQVMKGQKDFSFSGLKTAIARLVREHQADLDQARRAELSYTVQRAIVDTLLTRLREAIKATGIRRVVVAGGVSANDRLRKEVSALDDADVFFPSVRHCTDNAAMIALVAGIAMLHDRSAPLEISVRPRWPVETLANGVIG